MPDDFYGLPLHPLIVHATVVMIPLEALTVLLAAGWPRFRAWAGPLPFVISAIGLVLVPRPITTQGQGGSIPLCNVFQTTFPDAEIMLYGVEEPLCLIHVPNESVSPSEIERTALAAALFMRTYGAVRA